MEDLIVTIKGCSKGPLRAKRTVYEADGTELLTFESSNNALSEGKNIAEDIFRDFNDVTTVEVNTHDKPLGLYSLHNVNNDRMVLIKIA